MKVSKNDITGIIPQRPPFVMIDNLIDASAEGFESDFTASADNIFNQNGKLSEEALIENIAQTCAAGFGYLQKEEQGEPKIGFIGAISKLVVHSLPEINQLIHTRVSVLHQLEQVFLVKGENFCDGSKLVECEMKIVVT